MMVNEITVKIFLTEDIPLQAIRTEIAHFIDSYLMQEERFAEYHQGNFIKGYVWDLFVPIEKGMSVYKGNSIYQFRIRTVDSDLLSYFLCGIADHRTDVIKGLTRTVKQIPKKPIAKVFTITPYVQKNLNGSYWRDCMSFEEFETELRKSLIHQYEAYSKKKLNGDFPIYDQIELQSKCAVKIPYKGIALLGDKLSMQVADNENAQEIIYFTLGNGWGMGSRGMSFLGYRFV